MAIRKEKEKDSTKLAGNSDQIKGGYKDYHAFLVRYFFFTSISNRASIRYDRMIYLFSICVRMIKKINGRELNTNLLPGTHFLIVNARNLLFLKTIDRIWLYRIDALFEVGLKCKKFEKIRKITIFAQFFVMTSSKNE